MAEEKKNNEVEELDAKVAETADEAVDAAEAAAADLTDEVQELDEKVETAVRNVADEAVDTTEEVAETVEETVAEAEATADEAVAEVEDKAEEVVADEPKKRERRSKQARAQKEAKSAVEAAPAEQKSSAYSLAQLIGVSAVCLALGLLLGKFLLGGTGASTALANKTTVTEGELNTPIATYNYNGSSNDITIRQIIEGNGTLEAADQGDGNYAIPTPESAITYARQAILSAEVEKRGITASEDEVKEYTKKNLGNDDFEAIGATYGMEADKVKTLLEQNCKFDKLQSEIVGEELPAAPEAPAQAEEGKEDEVKKEYGEYIIKLAGDQWNAEKGEWADKEGSYAKALADYEISADKGANYKAAQAAYFVAYQDYSAKQSELTTKWTEFMNGLFSNANISVNSLIGSSSAQ